MENLFIPKKESEEVKGLGFNEPCVAHWHESGYLEIGEVTNQSYLLAPTWDQVFEWFREVHNFQHNIEWNKFYINQKIPYEWVVRHTWRDQILQPYGYGGFSSSYREAQIACLQRMIEQVKSNS